MKKTILNIVLLILVFIFTDVSLLCQLKIDTNGVFNNTGKINVKKKSINSVGQINNENGQIFIKDGNASIKQSEVNGYVEFESDVTQYIPNLIYDSIAIKGGEKFFNDKNKNLVSKSYFTSSSSNLQWNPSDNIEIQTNGFTRNDGEINSGRNHGKVKMNGTNLQELTGFGRYKVLELDNNAGAQVVELDEGQFRVATKLILTNGRLRNDEDNNFIMESKSVLERTANGTIDLGPFWESTGNITYKTTPIGNGNFVSYKDFRTGPELLNSTTNDVVLVDTLIVENPGGVKLDTNLTVAHRIQLNGGDIHTFDQPDLDSNYITSVINENELTLTGQDDPEFINGNEEIRGRFTRKNITSGRNYTFNNKYTYASFANEVDRSNVTSLTMAIKKQTRYPANEPFLGNDIAGRTIKISAKDDSDNDVVDNINLFYQFAWRNSAFKDLKDGEMAPAYANFSPTDFRLLQFSEADQRWANLPTQNQRKLGIVGDELNWSLAESNINSTGVFGIGVEQISLDFMRFYAKVALEGAFKLDLANNLIMKKDLADSSRIPITPPPVYPYILDPNRAFISNTQFPADAVDWVVLEYRNDDFNPDPNKRYFKTCILKQDGSLVDVDGITPVTLSKSSTQGLDTTGATSYYVAIRHRNHLTIMSESPLTLSRDQISAVYDFTNASFVSGGTNSVKPMGRDLDGNLIFAAYGGNLVSPNVTRNEVLNGILGIDEINSLDYEPLWDFTDFEGYIDADFEMSGYVNSKDFNISWNNRTQTSVIK